MKCVYYNPDTLEVTSYGAISPEAFEIVSAEGRPIISVDEFPEGFKPWLYDVDPVEKVLVLSANPRPDPTSPPPIPEPQIPPISDRQFYQQAALGGYITQSDALAAVQTGFIPAILQQLVDETLDPEEKFNAQMLLAGATVFYRQHPLTTHIGEAFGLSTEQLDNFWIEAAKL